MCKIQHSFVTCGRQDTGSLQMEYPPLDFGGALGQCKLTLSYCTGYFKVKQVREHGVYGTCFHNHEELLVKQHPASPKDTAAALLQ